jgi:hypothetical protein
MTLTSVIIYASVNTLVYKNKKGISMSERQQNNGNWMGKSNGAEVRYADGTSNLVWDRIGAEVDFSHNKYLDGPSDITLLRVVFDHDQDSKVVTELILFGDGDDMVRRDTHILPAGREFVQTSYEKEGGMDLLDYMMQRPRTISSRPSGFGGGRLVGVEALYKQNFDPPTSGKEGITNPIIVANEVRMKELSKA